MRKSLLVLLTSLLAGPLAAQTPGPLRLTFGDAVRRATGQAPAVALADLATDEARARLRQTRSGFFPTLSVGAAWVNRDFNSHSFGFSFPGFPTLIGPFNNYDARMTLTQNLLDFGTVKRARAAAVQVTGVIASGGAASERVAQTAAVAYLRGARAAAAVLARQSDSSIAVELLGLAQAQLQAGVNGTLDVTRAKAQVAGAEGALVVARNQLDQARITLARALGIDPATPIELVDTLSSGLVGADVPTDPDSAIARAIAARPDLQAEAARGQEAEMSRAAIRSEILPRVGLEADYGLNGLTWPASIGTRQLALAVSVPLLDGFRREGRVAEQDAVLRESQVRERDLRQQIAAEVDGALLDLRTAGAQEAIAAERLGLAQDELSQAKARFKAGVAGNIEVIDAQATMVMARDAVIDARFAAAMARVALARAAGAARTLH